MSVANDTFFWAAKSGIQKGIRRGNLDLVKTCFNILWESKQGRGWLKWRLPIIVEEDVWFMVPSCAEFLSENGDLSDSDVVRKSWLKFLYTLTLVDKSKDSEPLYYLATRSKYSGSPEVVDFRKFLNDNSHDSAYLACRDLMQRALDGDVDITDYELSGIELMVKRSQAGGMPSDAWCCVACIYLILNRGIGKYEVDQHIKTAYKRIKGIPDGVSSFPWWVFDSHTRIGKFALSRFYLPSSLSFITRDVLNSMIFYFESAKIPLDNLRAKNVISDADCFDSILWVPQIKSALSRSGKSVKYLKDLWVDELRSMWMVEISDIMRSEGVMHLPIVMTQQELPLGK